MPNLNRVFLIGRLTRAPELRQLPNGSSVCTLDVAVNRRWTTKDGQEQEEVLFAPVTVWNRPAENAAQFLTKGSLVHVEGHLRMDSWEDKETGEKRSKMVVIAERVAFLDRAKVDATG